MVSMGYFHKRAMVPWLLWVVGVGMLSFVQPVFGDLLDYPVFGMSLLTLRNLAGVLLIMIGFWIYKNYM